jgi:hypothetical protein
MRLNTETFVVRLPPDLKLWLVKQSQKNGSSQNSEIIRAVRERKEKVSPEKEAAHG